MTKGLAALVVLFLAAHLPFLPPTLEDIDSINFALGVRDFDVARHQPHPPGYPVFIALARVSTPVLRGMQLVSPEPRGLALWSTLAGAALIPWLFLFIRALDGSERRAWWTTVIAVTSPLFWFTALRPLSDMTGVCAAVAAQALTSSVIAGRWGPRSLMWGGFLAGLAIGVRAQTFLLTLPLLGLALALPGLKLHARDRLATLAATGLGVLAWGIPLLLASGGLSAYAAALGTQAGEDFSGVVMLWNTRSLPTGIIARVAADALIYSFLWPWGRLMIGAAVIGVACLGSARLAWRMPRTLFMVVVAFVPYAIFHLLFHEVVTVRYALPLVLPVAFLVVYALDGLGRAALAGGAVALGAVSMVIAFPAAAMYGRAGSPTFRLLSDIRAAAHGDDAHVDAVGMHAVMRRAAEWVEPSLPGRVLKGPHGREWLTLVEEWRSHPDSAVSFVADPRRTDLALFDASRRIRGPEYRWGFVEPPFVGGARPGNADGYLLAPPGWMLDRGWALTAEVAGITARDGWGPYKRPSVAWIRRRDTEALLMIGGRHLGSGADPAVRVSVTLSGRPLQAFDVKPGYFFERIPVPAGGLQGGAAYLPIEVTSEAADGSRREIPVALEQFDLQSAGAPMVGAEAGWLEPEYDPRTARAWRWTTERATLWVRPIGRDVTLTLAGESPLRYFEGAPTVTVTIAGRQVARFAPSSDFSQEIVLPADALASADGRVVVASDKWFAPADRGVNADRRHLALRIYSYGVR